MLTLSPLEGKKGSKVVRRGESGYFNCKIEINAW